MKEERGRGHYSGHQIPGMLWPIVQSKVGGGANICIKISKGGGEKKF